MVAHGVRDTSCEPAVPIENTNPIRPSPRKASVRTGASNQVSDIEGYSLNYINIPEIFFSRTLKMNNLLDMVDIKH